MTEIFGKMEGDSGLPQVTKDDVRRTLRTYREFLSGFRERRVQAFEETLEKISSGFLRGCQMREVNVRQMSSPDPVYSFFCKAEDAMEDLITRKLATINAEERMQLRILDAVNELDPLSRLILLDCYCRGIPRARIGGRYRQLIQIRADDEPYVAPRTIYRILETALDTVVRICNDPGPGGREVAG